MRIDNPNAEKDFQEYVAQKLGIIENEIRRLSNEYILNVRQEEYINMLVAKHEVSFEIYYTTQRLYYDGDQKKQVTYEEFPGYYGNMITRTLTEYKFHLKYKFSGDIDVLRIKPNSYSWNTSFVPLPIEIFDDELTIHFISHEMDKHEIQKQIDKIKEYEFKNLEKEDGVKKHIQQFNKQLPQEIKQIFEKVKAEKGNEHRVLQELGVINHSSASIEVPIVKRIVPTPQLVEGKNIVSYHVNENIYKSILKHIYILSKDYERHESAYRGRQEEDLRDLIVSSLNSVFIGTNSSGETFNRTGKTDIITKAPDNSNIFIAECKIWRGEKMFLEAIDQLLGYVTWRDTKTALILFVKNSGIVEIIDKAKSTIAQHPCYVNYKTQTGESSFSYIFHTKDDAQSQIALELMIFHYPE